MNIILQPSSKLTFIKNPLQSPQRLTSSLQITNNGSNTVAFLIRTNSGQKYTLKPDRCQIKSGDTISVAITMVNKHGETQEADLFFLDFVETAGFNSSESDQKIFWDQVQNKNVRPMTFVLSVDFYKREDYSNKCKSLLDESRLLNKNIVLSQNKEEHLIRELRENWDTLTKKKLIMSQRQNSEKSFSLCHLAILAIFGLLFGVITAYAS